jgi:small subunit ribosomal protein S15
VKVCWSQASTTVSPGNRTLTVPPALQKRVARSRKASLTAAYSTTQTMSQPVKSEVIAQYKTHEKDTGSSDVQIALLTARINHLTEHLRTHRKDFHSRRGLLQMASRRRKLLDYVKSEDLAKYNDLLQKLNLRK